MSPPRLADSWQTGPHRIAEPGPPGEIFPQCARHTRSQFFEYRGSFGSPRVNSTVPNFVPSTNPDGVGLNSVSCNASRCCTSLLLLSALGAHSVQVVDSPFVRNSKFADTSYLGGSTPPPGTRPKYIWFNLLPWRGIRQLPSPTERNEAARSISMVELRRAANAAEFLMKSETAADCGHKSRTRIA